MNDSVYFDSLYFDPMYFGLSTEQAVQMDAGGGRGRRAFLGRASHVDDDDEAFIVAIHLHNIAVGVATWEA